MDSKTVAGAQAPERTRPKFVLSYDSQGVLAGALDGVAIVATSLLMGSLYQLVAFGHVFEVSDLLGAGIAAALVFIPLVAARGAYVPSSLLSPSKQVRRILLAWGYAMTTLLGFAFLMKASHSFSRGAVVLLAVAGPVALVTGRHLLCRLFDSAFETGRLARRRVVLVAQSDSEHLQRYLRAHRGYSLNGIFPVPDPVDDRRLVHCAQEVLAFVRRSAPDEIHVALHWRNWDQIKTLAEAFRAVPLPVRLIPDPSIAEVLSYGHGRSESSFAVELQREPLTWWELRAKRTLDLTLAGLGLFILAPLLAALAVMVRLDTPGPVLFRQTRKGFNGRTFTIYKFRTMSVQENGSRVTQARRDDPRVTRVGRWLRRMSLDELPQLINVLTGEMSLVGPRPHAVAHDDQYTRLIANYAVRHHVKPGITGWAQVNGHRGETPTIETMQDRIDHDLWYIANWSFWLDLWILARTVVELLRPRNAF